MPAGASLSKVEKRLAQAHSRQRHNIAEKEPAGQTWTPTESAAALDVAPGRSNFAQKNVNPDGSE